MNSLKSLVGVWVLGVLACAGPRDVTPMKVISLEVTAPGATFSAGSTVQLEAAGQYSNGSQERMTDLVRWSSSDESRATVDASGAVKLIAPGSVAIVASLDDVSRSFTLQVTASVIRALEFAGSDVAELSKGQTSRLHVEAVFGDGSRRDVCADATWTTSGGIVTATTTKGEFRFESEGQVMVSARFERWSAERVVRVGPAAITEVRLAAFGGPLKPGQRAPVQVSATFSDGTSRDVSMEAQVSSLDPSIAEVNDGIVLARSAGVARLVAQLGGHSGTRSITITARELVSLVSSFPSIDLPGGRSVQLQLFAGFDDGSTLDVSEAAAWLTSDSTVAEIRNGLVFAHAQGNAQLTASFGGRSIEITVFVHAPVLEQLAITLPQNARLLEGQTASFVITGRFSDGANLDLSQVASLRPSPLVIVTQSASGVSITGVGAGPASVEIEVSGMVRRLSLTVSDASITRLRMVQRFTEAGAPLPQLRVEADYSDGFSQDVTEQCAWSSSDAAQIWVSDTAGERGTFRGAGAATVSAELMHQWVSFNFVMP